MEARAKSCSISLRELYSWVANQLQAMQKPGCHFQYSYQTEPICKDAWQRIHGIGDRVLARARKLLANETKVYLKAPSTQAEVTDLVSVLLVSGLLLIPKSPLMEYVREHWREACKRLTSGSVLRVDPDRPPNDKTINKIWRTEYKNVSFVRDGDFSKDDICTDLVAEHSRGFRTEEEAKDWKRRNQLHHRTHRSCRVASMKRKKGAPSDMFSIVISSDMKPPGEWHGVNDDPNGEPIKIFLKRPEGDLPPKLPVGAFVTPRLRRTSALSPETYGEGDLPGRPAHMECVDASGKIWRIDLRVLDELPTNWLELPPQRKEKIQALHSLTKEELENLPRTYFVNDGNPPAHPPWRGAQELTPEEKQAQDIAFASASAPWRKVTHLLRISQNKETFAASHMVMKELKLWLREHGVATQDKDRKQFVKKKLIDLVWEHSQICSCGLEEDDNKEMKDEVDAPSADEPEPESEQEPESAAAPARGRGGRRGRQAAAAPARGRGRRGGRRRGRRVAGSARGRGGARARKRARSEGDGRSLPSRRRREPAAKELPKVPNPDGPWECPTCHFFNEQGGERCELCEWPSLSDDSETSTEYDEEMEVDAEESEPEPKSDPEQEPEPAAAPARGRGGRGGRRRGRRVAGSARGGGGARKCARSEEDGKSLPPRRRHQLVIEELPGALSEGEWECPRPTCRFINKTGGGVCEIGERGYVGAGEDRRRACHQRFRLDLTKLKAGERASLLVCLHTALDTEGARQPLPAQVASQAQPNASLSLRYISSTLPDANVRLLQSVLSYFTRVRLLFVSGHPRAVAKLHAAWAFAQTRAGGGGMYRLEVVILQRPAGAPASPWSRHVLPGLIALAPGLRELKLANVDLGAVGVGCLGCRALRVLDELHGCANARMFGTEFQNLALHLQRISLSNPRSQLQEPDDVMLLRRTSVCGSGLNWAPELTPALTAYKLRVSACQDQLAIEPGAEHFPGLSRGSLHSDIAVT
eukprot:g59311.t1